MLTSVDAVTIDGLQLDHDPRGTVGLMGALDADPHSECSFGTLLERCSASALDYERSSGLCDRNRSSQGLVPELAVQIGLHVEKFKAEHLRLDFERCELSRPAPIASSTSSLAFEACSQTIRTVFSRISRSLTSGPCTSSCST
jgi:hypothetical protein